MGETVRRATLVAILVVSAAGPMRAQGTFPVATFDPPDAIPEALSFFAPIFIPKIFQDEYRLKEYICGEEFARFRGVYGDLQAVDAIFDRALHLCWNNTGEALLICLLCTMDHRSFGVRLPVVGDLIWLPLTSEFPDEFQVRVKALPTQLYPDTPPGKAGDRDKLQHFFGSAYLALLTESSDAAERTGEFVEWGEEEFIVGGVNDWRDLRADWQGGRFGIGLMRNIELRPSSFFSRGVH
jgi:hypothetical protein